MQAHFGGGHARRLELALFGNERGDLAVAFLHQETPVKARKVRSRYRRLAQKGDRVGTHRSRFAGFQRYDDLDLPERDANDTGNHQPQSTMGHDAADGRARKAGQAVPT